MDDLSSQSSVLFEKLQSKPKPGIASAPAASERRVRAYMLTNVRLFVGIVVVDN